MGKIFTINWPKLGKAVEAELIANQDRELRESFWNALPFSSIQSHAVCAGLQMYSPFRLVCLPSNPNYEPMNEQGVGRVNLELHFQQLAITYGPLSESVPALPIAQIRDEHIEDIIQIGKMAWENLLFNTEFILVHFDKKEEKRIYGYPLRTVDVDQVRDRKNLAH